MMLIRFLRWFIFTLLVSILPILVSAIALWLSGDHPSIVEILGAGELLMICCALSATAVGDIVATKLRHPNAKLIFAGLCVLVVVVTTVGYTLIVVANHRHFPYDQNLVAIVSMCLFLFTGICSAVCVALSH
jgi:hypothetical protein